MCTFSGAKYSWLVGVLSLAMLVIGLYILSAPFCANNANLPRVSLVTAEDFVPMPNMCTTTFVAKSMWVNHSSCYLDEQVTDNVGTLEYPCQGGYAVAYFGGQKFSGQVTDGEVLLASETSYDFVDGCTWETHQYISGNIAEKELRFSYSEEPQQGDSGCGGICAANVRLLAR